jgi:hypothetical protein
MSDNRGRTLRVKEFPVLGVVKTLTLDQGLGDKGFLCCWNGKGRHCRSRSFISYTSDANGCDLFFLPKTIQTYHVIAAVFIVFLLFGGF